MERGGKTALHFFLTFFFLIILQFTFSSQAFGESVSFYGETSSSCPATLNISYCSDRGIDCATQAKNSINLYSNKVNNTVRSEFAIVVEHDKKQEEVKNTTHSEKDINPQSGLDSETLLSLVNNHRQKLGHKPFEKEESLCKIAESRAIELYDEIFEGRMHAGFFVLNLPYMATENIIFQNSEEAAINWWLSSPLHRSSIVGNYTHSCVACYGKTCTQIFTSFIPKQIFANSEFVKGEDGIQ